jgi:hypothetical protein
MKYILPFLCLSLLAVPAAADEFVRSAGDKSLNFSFSDFAVGDYKYGIGGKYWSNNTVAITGSINVHKTKQEMESTSTATSSITSADITSYGFSIGVEKHFHSSTSISPYMGGELYYSDSDANAKGAPDAKATEWGGNILLGAEYSFNDAIALAAEYSFGYRDSDTETTNSTGTNTRNDKGFDVSSGELILLLYF